MFSTELTHKAESVLADLRAIKYKLTVAESCTGGLLAALFTSIPGASSVFERGFVTYSNDAKSELLGIPMSLIEYHGAVSEETARAMAEGALSHSRADIALSITGIAGPGGGTSQKPVGLVYIGLTEKKGRTQTMKNVFAGQSREQIQLASIQAALELITS